MRNTLRLLIITITGLLPAVASAATVVSDNFASNPLSGGSGWSFGVGSNNTSASGPANQFVWNAAGQPAGLTVELNSSSPTARLDHPLGTTFSESSNFTVTADFTLNNIVAPADQFMEISFGLTNSSTTGGDRTGSIGNFSSDNTSNMVEFDYFPNPAFGGPFLEPAIFGGQVPGQDAFSNAVFVGNQPIPALPMSQEFKARMSYDASTQTLTTTMFEVMPGGGLVQIDSGLTPLNVTDISVDSPNDGFYDVNNPFIVNTLSIMAYNDGFTTSDAPSIVGDITYQNISVISTPEPSSLVLTLIAALGGLAFTVRRTMLRGKSQG